jgi:probable F420-dependent oxidoreductase
MNIGAVFPQTEIGSDVELLRDWIQTAEGLAYDYVLSFDHVLGASPDRAGGWDGPYTDRHMFHEPLTLYAYWAALTRTIEFTTGILILPQRQTALVAKQAAQIDLLSGGRLRLGVGVGWNAVEYEALNMPFSSRGRMLTEQVEVLRRLWTQPLVDFQGEFHSIPSAGINPLPLQQPIPIWFGGHSEAALRRAARLGDGWIPNSFPPDVLEKKLNELRQYLDEYGRDSAQFGVDYHILLEDKSASVIARECETLRALGVTHLCLYTMGAGLSGGQHIDALRSYRAALG